MKKRLLAKILIISMMTSVLAGIVRGPVAQASTAEYVQPWKTYSVGDTVYFGNYWQNDTNSDGTADQNDTKEPIEWRVLSHEGDDLFLMSAYILDVLPYNETNVNVTWETCTLRTWLNDDFYNDAFSAGERNAIKTTTLENKDNPTYGTKGGNNTNDKVFLLSLEDVTNTSYGFSSSVSSSYDSNRRIRPTEYALDNGAYVSIGYCYWWLRSPGSYRFEATYVSYDGFVSSSGSDVDSSITNVCPALHLNLKSINDIDDINLFNTKEVAKEELDTYKNLDDYRDAEKEELADAIAAGKEAIDACTVIGDIVSALANAKAAMDVIKTDAQLTAEELVVTKDAAKAELDAYKSADDYRDAEKIELENAIVAGKEAINCCATIGEVDTALANAKAILDEIKTDDELKAEELAQAKFLAIAELRAYKFADDYRDNEKILLSNVIAMGEVTINVCTTINDVASALANAKAAMDVIKTDAQLKAEEEANKTPIPSPTTKPTTKPTQKPTTTATPTPTKKPGAPSSQTPAPVQVFGDYQYKVKNDGTIEITKYSGDSKVVQIPATIDGYKVTSIGDTAFANNDTLQNVFMPEYIETIGERAFDSCLSLANIGFNANTKAIGDHAFYNCPALTMVALPENVLQIGDYAFGYDSANKHVFGFYITGYSGTVAETYAKENGLTFTSVGESGGTTIKKVTLKFTKKSVKIKRGKKVTLKVKLTGAKKATFSVDKKGKKVVKLSKKKAKSVVVTGKKKGKAVITAKAAGKTAKCKVTVK